MRSLSKIVINEKDIKYRIGFPEFLLILLAVTDISKYFGVISILTGNIATLSLGAISILYILYNYNVKSQISIFIFMFVYIFCGAIGILFNNNMDFQELFWPFAYIGFSILFLNYTINPKVARNIYYSILFILIIRMFTSGSVNNLNLTSSRNTISILALLYFSIYVISLYKNRIKITIVPLIMGFITVILAVGRSGILTFTILLVMFALFDFNSTKQRTRNPIKLVVILLVLISIIYLSYNMFDDFFIETIQNFENRGFDSIRTIIWKEYIEKTISDTSYILLGTPIEGSFILNTFKNNLHNSYLMLHAKYGLIVFLLVIFKVMKSLKYFVRTKNYLFLSLILAILFRSQFDYTNFNGPLDIILFYLIFYPNYNKRNIQQ